MDDDVYDVPPPRISPELPPSLPPKKSSKSSSFHEIDGLSRTAHAPAPAPRPKPKPRKTVRSSSNVSDNGAVSPTTPTALSPTIPTEEASLPVTTPKPVPRPRPRRSSFKSPDPVLDDIPFPENLPPSADEVEELVNEMVKNQFAQEDEKMVQAQQQLQNDCTMQHSSSAEASAGKSSMVETASPAHVDLASSGSCYENTNEVKDKANPFYENNNAIKSFFNSKESGVKKHQDDIKPESGGMFEITVTESDPNQEYAKVQKQKKEPVFVSDTVSEFDPFLTDTSRPIHPAQLEGGILQPTKVWDSLGSAADGEGQTSQRDSLQYEAVWFQHKQDQDKPGMVQPQLGLMSFTPDVVPPCEPVFGERNGEYVGLDSTYNIPPPSAPPPPLPPESVISSVPPSIPPRPAQVNASSAHPFVFEQFSSHLSESTTEDRFQPKSCDGVFEALPTPGFTSPFQDDDPFKYSDFSSECQEFNNPLSTNDSTAAAAFANPCEGIYEIGDNNFVPQWPQEFGGETENTYNEIEGESKWSLSGASSTSSSVRLSQVPPPPPRSGRCPPVPDGARATPSLPRSNLYSMAHLDEQDLSQSVDSSDSSEDLFSLPDNQGSSSLPRSGPISIVNPSTPRKNERYGYLYKQGGIKANQGWRMRWVVFNGKDLRYYDNNRSQISKKIIPLSSMKEVRSDIKEGDTNRFKFHLVTTLRNRTFLFAADTRDDCCQWTSTLMAAILTNNANGITPESETSQPDKEGFIRFENNKKKFYVAIWGKTLCYYDSFEDFQMHCPVHEIDMKLSSVKSKKKNQLQLSTHYAHFSLLFESPQEAQSWRMAIEDAIAEGLADDSVLEKVYENDSNRICADCEDDNPHWASINLGIVLCKKCAGIHRMFDSSISKIRSLRMDTRVWTPSLIEVMKAIGNGHANLFWEHDLLPIQKLPKDALPETRKQYAQLKYQAKRYSNQHPLAHDKTKLNEALLQVSATSDLLEAMKIIFSGADLSYTGGPERENAYQTAKRHGQRLLMELLYQNGGDCSSLDEESINEEGRLREDVRLQGYLLKTGPAGRTFDQRWCVLEHGALTYYLNEKSTTAKDSIDRKAIECLQEVTSERQENVFEISTSKSGGRVYTFAALDPNDRGTWMRTLGKLISPVAVMEHVGMMDFSLAALVYMRESRSEEWRQTWVMLSWRLLYYMNKELRLDHIDLRKATQIRHCQTDACPLCTEKGTCFVVSSPGQSFYIQANSQKDTARIMNTITTSMKLSGNSLLDQQLTADEVPVIVDKCLTQISTRGLREEGIYRKAATQSKVNNLIDELKKDAYAVRLEEYDIHEVANALKRFLRGLEDSLFMRERYTEWIRTCMIEDHSNRYLWYRYLLEKLPRVNYYTLRRIVLHIWKMAQCEEENKMNVSTFCTCFAPTLMQTDSNEIRGNNLGHEIKVLSDLLAEREYLFQVEKEEKDHEDKMAMALKKIKDAENSQPSNSFLVPVTMHSASGPCEMVNMTPTTSAQEVVDYLRRKCSLTTGHYVLCEVVFQGALVRPLFPRNTLLELTQSWADWEDSIRKEMSLCLMDTTILHKLHTANDGRLLFGEVKYADSKSRTKFQKTTVEFKQCNLAFFKDAKLFQNKKQLCSWKVEDLNIYLGLEPKRSPPSSFGFTFVVNGRDEKRKSSSNFGHCVSLGSEEEMYRWAGGLLHAQMQSREDLLVWDKE